MITPDAASLVIAVTRGIVKLGGRVDGLLAEKEVTGGALAIPMPVVVMPDITAATKVDRLKGYLDETTGRTPDPLGPDRRAITALLAKAEVENVGEQIDAVFERIFPGKARASVADPDNEFLKALGARLPTLDLSNPDTRLACFYCAAGHDTRQIDYPARLALLVADVLAEFAAENTALIVRDERARVVVQSVIERLAKPQLEDFTAWSPLLRHTLGATMDGLLANRDALASAKPWVDAVLDALAMARDEAENGEDFVTGLVCGKGYRTLLASGITVAGARLAADGAAPYKQIAADVLRAAAPHVTRGSQSFATFFHDNWGDLLRAGLTSVERYGPRLLEGEKPIVREATLALVEELARAPNASLFSGDTLYGIANAVIGNVASRPELIAPGKPWLADLVGSLAQAASDQALQKSLTREGLRDAFRAAALVLGRHPELLADQPAQRVEMIGAVLRSVGAAGTVDAKTLATSAISSVLTRIGEQPTLLDTRYAEILAGFAGEIATLVGKGTLGSVQATDVIDAAAAAVLRNPELFAKLEGKVATAVLRGVMQGSQTSPLKVLGGKLLVDTLAETLRVVAVRGRDLVETKKEEALVTKVADTVSAGLALSQRELGRRLDVTCVPLVLAGLVAAVARGEINSVDANDAKFQAVFGVLAEAAIATVQAKENA
jgi:hypothetical protein